MSPVATFLWEATISSKSNLFCHRTQLNVSRGADSFEVCQNALSWLVNVLSLIANKVMKKLANGRP